MLEVGAELMCQAGGKIRSVPLYALAQILEWVSSSIPLVYIPGVPWVYIPVYSFEQGRVIKRLFSVANDGGQWFSAL